MGLGSVPLEDPVGCGSREGAGAGPGHEGWPWCYRTHDVSDLHSSHGSSPSLQRAAAPEPRVPRTPTPAPRAARRPLARARARLGKPQPQVGTALQAGAVIEERALWIILGIEAGLILCFFCLAISLLWWVARAVTHHAPAPARRRVSNRNRPPPAAACRRRRPRRVPYIRSCQGGERSRRTKRSFLPWFCTLLLVCSAWFKLFTLVALMNKMQAHVRAPFGDSLALFVVAFVRAWTGRTRVRRRSAGRAAPETR